MCGIAGVLARDTQYCTLPVLTKMGDAIAHRGPDDRGHYLAPGVGLYHRRLSIIDLSKHGHQPMFNESKSICLVYNGEIYNYKELTGKLVAANHNFQSSCDSEVVVHAYEQYGVDCVNHFNGMFAFALWDSESNTLFAARDRIGIKPFYYFFDGSTFVFGSEIKALIAHPAVSVSPNLDAIRNYHLFGHALDDQTWYSSIKQLPPGWSLTLENGDLRLRQYWDLEFDADYDRTFDSIAEELRHTVQDSIRRHLQSDVPVGAYLSGGIDSSTVVAVASGETQTPIHTFSAAFEEGIEFDEREYVRIISGLFKTNHHQVIPNSEDLSRLLPTLIWHLDEPVIGAAILPMYRVCALVAQHGVKVVNGGQGGDELFGGYPPFYVAAARSLLENLGASRDSFAELIYVPQYLSKGGAFSRLLQKLQSGPRNPAAGNWLRTVKGNGTQNSEVKEKWQASFKLSNATDSFDEMTYVSLKHYLPGLLQQEDRMSMAWSIESRVPLLDHSLVELSARIPSWFKVRRGVLKSIFREAMRDIVPDRILDRQDKKGYPTPSSIWLAGELSGYLRKNLQKQRLLCEDLIDASVVSDMVDAHIAGTYDHGSVLWKVLNTELWMRGMSNGWSEVERRSV